LLFFVKAGSDGGGAVAVGGGAAAAAAAAVVVMADAIGAVDDDIDAIVGEALSMILSSCLGRVFMNLYQFILPSLWLDAGIRGKSLLGLVREVDG